MKKWIFTTTLCLSSMLLASEQKIQNIQDLEGPELLAFYEGRSPETIVKIEEGSTFPLEILTTGDILSFEPKTVGLVTAKKTLYVRAIANETYLLSTDGVNFISIIDFFTGSLVMGFGKSEEDPEMKIDITLNLNQKNSEDPNSLELN